MQLCYCAFLATCTLQEKSHQRHKSYLRATLSLSLKVVESVCGRGRSGAGWMLVLHGYTVPSQGAEWSWMRVALLTVEGREKRDGSISERTSKQQQTHTHTPPKHISAAAAMGYEPLGSPSLPLRGYWLLQGT